MNKGRPHISKVLMPIWLGLGIVTPGCVGKVPLPTDVHYATGQHELTVDADVIAVGRVVERLESDSSLRLAIIGHTDDVGDPEKNEALSFRRATAVRRMITEAEPQFNERITVAFHGEFVPVGDNATEEGRARNRRVELYLFRPDKDKSDRDSLQVRFDGALKFKSP